MLSLLIRYIDLAFNRDFHAPLTKYEKIGEKFFEDIYGGTAKSVQTLLDDIYPDMGKVRLKLDAPLN